MRANRRRLAHLRRRARRRHEQYVSSEAKFWLEAVSVGVFAGTFKAFWVWGGRLKFQTRMKVYFSPGKIAQLRDRQSPFYSLVAR